MGLLYRVVMSPLLVPNLTVVSKKSICIAHFMGELNSLMERV